MGISFEEMKSKMKEKNWKVIDRGHTTLTVRQNEGKTEIRINSIITGKVTALNVKCSDEEIAEIASILVGLCPDACKRAGIVKQDIQESETTIVNKSANITSEEVFEESMCKEAERWTMEQEKWNNSISRFKRTSGEVIEELVPAPEVTNDTIIEHWCKYIKKRTADFGSSLVGCVIDIPVVYRLHDYYKESNHVLSDSVLILAQENGMLTVLTDLMYIRGQGYKKQDYSQIIRIEQSKLPEDCIMSSVIDYNTIENLIHELVNRNNIDFSSILKLSV